MSKAQLVITAVVLEGRSKSDVARDYEISRQWVHQLVTRYKTDGAAALEPRSRRPYTNARAISAELEERIVRLRKTLDKAGYDAGAATIAKHLARDHTLTKLLAVSTIWRVLSRRGFVVPQPHQTPPLGLETLVRRFGPILAPWKTSEAAGDAMGCGAAILF